MIKATDLQSAYVTLYKYIRNYILDFDTVNALAELEVETYRTFPSIRTVSTKLTALDRLVRQSDVLSEDDELKESISSFMELLTCNDDEVYANLKTFKEVIPL